MTHRMRMDSVVLDTLPVFPMLRLDKMRNEIGKIQQHRFRLLFYLLLKIVAYS